MAPSARSLRSAARRCSPMGVADPDPEAAPERDSEDHRGLDPELDGSARPSTNTRPPKAAHQAPPAPGRVERRHDRPAPASLNDAPMRVHRHVDEHIEHAEQERADRQRPDARGNDARARQGREERREDRPRHAQRRARPADAGRKQPSERHGSDRARAAANSVSERITSNRPNSALTSGIATAHAPTANPAAKKIAVTPMHARIRLGASTVDWRRSARHPGAARRPRGRFAVGSGSSG